MLRTLPSSAHSSRHAGSALSPARRVPGAIWMYDKHNPAKLACNFFFIFYEFNLQDFKEKRCGTFEALTRANCETSDIVNPENYADPVQVGSLVR